MHDQSDKQPNSFVSLLGVDQSVTLLGSGNDIDRSRISADFDTYNAHEKFPELVIKGNKHRYLDFGESNAFILTNAFEGESKIMFDLRLKNDGEVMTEDEDESGLVETEIETSPDKPRKRKNFPETWIFTDFAADDDGKYLLSTKVPDTISSFIVS